MMLGWIEVGGVIFWLLLGAACIIEFIAAGKEKLWLALSTILAFVLIMFFFSNFPLWSYCSDNWVSILKGFGYYVLTGILWATLKWISLSRKRGIVYGNCLEDWAHEHPGSPIRSVNDIPLTERKDFFRSIANAFTRAANDNDWPESWEIYELRDFHASHSKPIGPDDAEFAKEMTKLQNDVMSKVLSSPFQHKESITFWMSVWPFSMLASFFFHFLYDLFNNIRRWLNDFYVWLSKLAFGKYRRDFANVRVKKDE